MRIGLLGPLEVWADNESAVEVGGTRLRTLLIVLALEPGRVVSLARIVDGIWGQEPPAGAVNAVQALVSRLRRALSRAQSRALSQAPSQQAIESHPAGYRLVIEPDAVDVTRFERLVAAGRSASDPATAGRLLREALELWRGPALLDVAEVDYFQPALTRLAELRLTAVEDRVEADLRLGRGGELIAELRSLVTEHPLRERLIGALMRALAAAGRPAEALTVYERARAELADALGADPSAELSRLHTALLRGELLPAAPTTAAPTTAAPDTVNQPPDQRPDQRPDQWPRTNLRAGLTSFVGRDEDVARVGKLVGEYRLITLTGPGGSGKTRLAIETARTLLEQTPDGVWLVELAAVTDGAAVPQAVLSAMGLREQALTDRVSAGEPVDRLAAALRTRNALLVLDNCEHLIAAAAAVADRLLGECPRLRILATSREPLGITGEALWPVEPLVLPPEQAGVVEAMSSPAVRLLADRAVAARPGFAVTSQTVADVVRICRALDGLPLAIELSAARLRSMTVEQLAGRLNDRFRLLTGGNRTALPRQQTLRAVVDWSWELLCEQERVLLRRLAIFSGGATAEAAQRVCAGGTLAADQVLDLLAALTDKSLLVTAGDGRYRMLETIKAYGLERLDQAGEPDQIRQAHADWFAELAETAEPHLRRAEQLVWLHRLAADHDNLTAALRGALAAGDARTAIRLAAASGWYWWLGGHKAEGADLVRQALAVPGATPDTVDAEQLAVAHAMLALFATAGLGDERQVEGLLRTAQQLARQTSSRHLLLRLLEPFARLVYSATEATPTPEDVLDSLLDDEDPWLRAQARLNRARVLVSLGTRQAEAQADIETALAAFRAIGERWGISFTLTSLADLVAQRGDLVAAQDYYEQAIVVVTEIGTVEDVVWMRAMQARLRWLLGDAAGSAAAMVQAERDAAHSGWPDGLAAVALMQAELARWRDDLRTARAQLARAQEALRQIVVHPVFQAIMLDTLAYLDAAEGNLDAARGHRSEALTLALSSLHAPTVGQVLVGVADLALRQGHPQAAAELLAASVAVRGGPDLSFPDAARVEKAVRAALTEHELAEAARRGQDATMSTVSDLAAPIVDDYWDTSR